MLYGSPPGPGRDKQCSCLNADQTICDPGALSRKVHFLHIGKTGGTALKHAFDEEARAGRIVLHDHGTSLSDLRPGETVFFFLRHPITRFVSGFLSRQREGRPRYFFPWSREEAEAFDRFATPNELASALSSVGCDRRMHAAAAMAGIQHVSDSFWRWLGTPESLISRSADILFIGQQEQLASDAAILGKRLGAADAALPMDDVAAHRNPDNLDRSLSPEAIRNLRCWYQRDFLARSICARIAKERGLGGSLAESGPAETEEG